jgi:glycosyltransferase involved in cell wall biosynthesis
MKTFDKIKQVWFWQNMLTPHMVELAVEFAKLGHDVTFVSNQILSKDRLELGWRAPRLFNVKFKLVKNKEDIISLAKKVSIETIHLVQGIRGNGILKYAQQIFRERQLNQWVMMETINNDRWLGIIKSILYRIFFFYWRKNIQGVLAIGTDMPKWVVKHGINKKCVYPFAYFLKEQNDQLLKISNVDNRVFRFIFVGQLIKRKRVDYLIRALATFKKSNFELWIIGTGKEKAYLQTLTNELLGDKKVIWFDSKPMHLIPKFIKQADCLVLPSQHDGWGAVVSEALMVGTPVICTDSCGSSAVVRASKYGHVVPVNNQNAFIEALRKQFKSGLWSLPKRKKLAKWASCLGAKSGAVYLAKILNYNKKNPNHIIPPWKLNIKNR